MKIEILENKKVKIYLMEKLELDINKKDKIVEDFFSEGFTIEDEEGDEKYYVPAHLIKLVKYKKNESGVGSKKQIDLKEENEK